MKVLALSGGKDSMACLFLMKEQLDSAIYVDTGYAYPETHAIIEFAERFIPVHRVMSQRDANIALEGIPADVVPVEWTPAGQIVTHKRPYSIQPSLTCCYANIAHPLIEKAKSLGATHIVYGQRDDEPYRSPLRDGMLHEGIVRLHPIERWTNKDVLDFLEKHMEIPEHFMISHSSLDCYDCTAFRVNSQDRLEWTKNKYPDLYAAYSQKYNAVLAALEASL